MHIADPRLRVLLKFPERHADALAMGFSHTVIAAHKGGERYRLRRGKREPSTVWIVSREAAWLLRGNSPPIGSPAQSASNTQR
jgi:hypothetical protein